MPGGGVSATLTAEDNALGHRGGIAQEAADHLNKIQSGIDPRVDVEHSSPAARHHEYRRLRKRS